MRDLDMRQNEAGDNTKQKDAAQNTRPKNILESFEYIVELAENSNLDKEFFEKIGKEETKRYFETAYQFVCEYKNLGEQYILSAKVH